MAMTDEGKDQAEERAWRWRLEGGQSSSKRAVESRSLNLATRKRIGHA
jgi:hypothetical protein